ncbi:MAG: RHS repeat-associated core domain-containing protein, partial [Phycisphaerales bacterium]|nr:RHS repeat-associated core domain-containing protein [Phycisphaerales bacterium]
YTYDPDTGQLTNIDYTDATPDIAFTYDRLGRIATVTDALGTHTFTYNAKLQLESEEIAGSIYDATITRTYQGTQLVPGRYDGFGIGMDTGNWNDDFQATYLFDTYGRLNHVSGTALPNCGVRYSYLTDSDLIERIEYEANLTTFAETVRSYESTRDLLTSVENKWGTTVISKYDYAYDNLRRRTSVINGGKAFVDHSEEAYSLYSYNDRNELTRSQRFEGTDLQAIPQVAVTGQDFEYQYDPIGNRTESSVDQGTATDYTVNNVNQYTSTANPAETFTYDADGNMTADDDFTYTYNMENRLVSVADSQGTILEFTYDYRGRRVRKVEHDPDPVNGGVIEDTRFVYDGWNVVLELDGQDNNAILRKYAWGLDLSGTTHGAGGIGGLLAVEDTDGTVSTNDDTPYLYFYDGNGNVGQLMDFSDTQTLSVAAHYEYDSYGNALVTVGAYAGTNPFRFSTKYFDDETGLYYHNNRFYATRRGRWLNRDPSEELGGRNIYQFVFNNPISWVDPNGRQPSTSQPTTPPIQPNAPPSGPSEPPVVGPPTPPIGPVPPPPPPEGVDVGGAGPHQNCAGRSCGINRFINWPHLGRPCPNSQWSQAQSFVPTGCREIPCEGDFLNHKPCCDCENNPPQRKQQIMLFLYRWVIGELRTPRGFIGPRPPVYQCDFHMIGREGCETNGWTSKQDRRNVFVDIRDPWISLHKSYPHTERTGVEVVQKCFCCDKNRIRTKRRGGVHEFE